MVYARHINNMNFPCFFGVTLQISEVVNSMKDLIDYSRETGTGPMGKFAIVYAFHCSKLSLLFNGKKRFGSSIQFLFHDSSVSLVKETFWNHSGNVLET